jgi:hypothetical protein
MLVIANEGGSTKFPTSGSVAPVSAISTLATTNFPPTSTQSSSVLAPPHISPTPSTSLLQPAATTPVDRGHTGQKRIISDTTAATPAKSPRLDLHKG